MNLIRLSIERPTAILAAVIILVVFGFVALRAIPIQLIPDVRKPLLTITTAWQGASPVDIEREIVISRNLRTVPETIEALAERLGLGRDRMRQIERRALSRLKFALLSRGVSSARAI